jgi:hypothetical protein
MAKTQQQIITEIRDYIAKQGGPNSNWYSGIATNVKDRLHIDHNVPEKDYWFIYRDAGSEANARAIESWFFGQYQHQWWGWERYQSNFCLCLSEIIEDRPQHIPDPGQPG